MIYHSAGPFFPYSTYRLLLEKERSSWCGIVYCKERSLSSNNENGISVWDIIYAGNEYLSDVFNMENGYIKKENKLG